MPASPRRAADGAVEPRARDREGTERRLLDAARAVLANDGFQGFGVNAIAREAGCDKQLIYRYYGGLEGLLDALGEDLAGWWGRKLTPLDALGRPEDYAELIQRMALSLLQALRDDPLMQKIVLWEVIEGSPQVQRLSMARARNMAEWMNRTRGEIVPPEGVDAPALNAMLIAAVHHIVVSGVNTGSFAGMDLRTEDDWERVRRTLRKVIETMYRAQ